MKFGRNDPCPCGSGAKYKRCCMDRDQARDAVEREHAGATEYAIRWLAETRREAMVDAYESLQASLAGADRVAALDELDPSTQSLLQINLMEWLLAEGSLASETGPQRISQLLLDSPELAWTPGQRSWLQRLAEHPLRLYEVVDLVPGRQITLRDALIDDATPIVIGDSSVSEWVAAGSDCGADCDADCEAESGAESGTENDSGGGPGYVACRVLPGPEGSELSGAAFPFPRLTGPAVAAMLRTAIADPDKSSADIGRAIMAAWVEHLFAEEFAEAFAE